MRFGSLNDDDDRFGDSPEYDEAALLKEIESVLRINDPEAKELSTVNEEIVQYVLGKLNLAIENNTNICSVEAVKLCTAIRDSIAYYRKNPFLNQVFWNVDRKVLLQDIDVSLIPSEIQDLVGYLRGKVLFKDKLNGFACDLLCLMGGCAREALPDFLQMLQSKNLNDDNRVVVLSTIGHINCNPLNETVFDAFIECLDCGDIDEMFSAAEIASDFFSCMVFENPTGCRYLFSRLRFLDDQSEPLARALSNITADFNSETALVPNFSEIAKEGILKCAELLKAESIGYSFAFDLIDIINNLLEFCLLDAVNKHFILEILTLYVKKGCKHALYPIQKLSPENQSILKELSDVYTGLMKVEYIKEKVRNREIVEIDDIADNLYLQDVQESSDVEFQSTLLETIAQLGISMQNLCPYVMTGIVSREKELRDTALDLFKKLGHGLALAITHLTDIYNNEQGYSEEVRDAAFKALKAVTARPKKKD